MLSINTLRNIHKKDFEKFFSTNKVKLRSKRIIPNAGEERYTPISRIIREELHNQTSFTDLEMDEFLFNQLFYATNNWHYVYQNQDINQIFLSEDLDEVISFIEEIEDLKYNNLLIAKLETNQYALCTTRLEIVDDKVKAIHFLFRLGNVKTDEGYHTFFSAVTVDVENNLVTFRFNQNLLDSFDEDPLTVISMLKDILNGENSNYPALENLQLNIIGFNEEVPQRIISQLFKELSADAENILNQRVPENTESDIREFLRSKGLPSQEDYIQQIKSVIYQDISQTCADTLFTKGWVFRFVFREGRITRASSRTDDKSPIYGSKVYWHLKELIFKSEEMREAGFHWYIDNPIDNEEPTFVQVRLEARNDSLIVHYYYKMQSPNRKEKEDYVLQKINGYFHNN
ncbi:hypothetical protein P8864_00870 [Priestia flexa]|uniref:hypothetical protein n=1 Tax=Priestia flexa TaxID=86664 RepID=UPI000C238F10|nr:hypothetical protein [Priestia flexa]MEC0664513.1 hypothetical protein [Priestia flexa]